MLMEIFGVWGGGNEYIQEDLNDFSKNDWEDLCLDVLNWSEFDQYVLIQSIPHGFRGWISSRFNGDSVLYAGDFLLNLFRITENNEIKEEIIDCSFFLKIINTKNYKGLEYIKKWMLVNNLNNNEAFLNIEEALKKAYD